jgi:hypothetical protein
MCDEGDLKFAIAAHHSGDEACLSRAHARRRGGQQPDEAGPERGPDPSKGSAALPRGRVLNRASDLAAGACGASGLETSQSPSGRMIWFMSARMP